MKIALWAAFVLSASACGAPERSSSPTGAADSHRTMSASKDDSIRTVVAAYEAGTLDLPAATQQLANLIEPLSGFAVGAGQSARAQELFRATSRELGLRMVRRRGLPDSLVR